MLTKLNDITNNSKYTATYCKIVIRAQNRVAIYSTKIAKKREATRLKGYVEAHHIIPRSVDPEHAKDSSNLVYLTPKEHYVCHLLLTKMFRSEVHNTKMLFAFTRISNKHGIKASMFYILKLKYVETNRQKAIKEMQDPATRSKFVQAGAQGGKKVRDANPKAWVVNSMGSEEGKAKAKQSCQTEEFRQVCRARELSKTTEERRALAKQGQQALVEKCGGEETYRKMLSDRMKGRQRYINPETGKMRITYECPEGFILKPTKGNLGAI